MSDTETTRTQTGALSLGAEPAHTILTVNDLVLLYRLSTGSTNAEIGASLARSEKTVRNQLTRLYRKLGVVNRAQAVATYLHEVLSASRSPSSAPVTRSGHSSHWSIASSRIRSSVDPLGSADEFSATIAPAAGEEPK